MKNLFSFLLVLAACSSAGAAPERVELMVQTGEAEAGALSPDGRFRAVGSSVWDVESGELRRVLPGRGVPAWSPDGRFLAVAGEGIRIWRMPEGTLVRFEKRGGRRVAWDGQGKRFIALENDHWGRGRVVVFDRTNPKWTRPLPTELRNEGRFEGPQLSPDGKRALVWDESYSSGEKPRLRAQLWNVETGKVEREFVSVPEVRTARFSPDGRLLALGLNSHNLVLWDVRDGSQRVLLNGPSGVGAILPVDQLAFSADGRELVAQTDDYRFRVWNVASAQVERVLSPRISDSWRTRANLLRFDRFATQRAIVDASGTEVGPLPLPPLDITRFAWARDGRRLVHDGGDRLPVWDFRSGALLAAPTILGRVTRLSLAPDALAATLELREWTLERTEQWRWKLPSGQLGKSRKLSLDAPQNEEGDIAPSTFSPDETLAAFAQNGGWSVREVATGKQRRLIKPPRMAEAFTFLSSHAALTVENGASNGAGRSFVWVRKWNLQSGASQIVFAGQSEPLGRREISRVSPSGRLLAGVQNSQGWIWSLPAKWKRFSLGLGTGRKFDAALLGWSALAFSPDEKWLATRNESGQIALRPLAPDGRPGTPVRVGVHATGEWHRMDSLAFSPDGRFLASGGNDGAFKIWRIPQKPGVNSSLALSVWSFPGDGQAQWLALAPDGRWTASPGAGKWAKWRRVGSSLTQPLLPLESQSARRDPRLLQLLGREKP